MSVSNERLVIVPSDPPIIHDQPYRIAIVAMAPADEEVALGRLLVGASGRELNGQLRLAGIMRGACYVTNVFDVQLPHDDTDAWCMTKKAQDDLLKAVLKEQGFLPPHWMLGFQERPELVENILRRPLKKGFYLHPDHWSHINRLRQELEAFRPNLIVALGNVALWALTGETGIDKRRGAVTESVLVPGVKMLSTYHPAFILRDYTKRHVAIADLMRARREGEFPEVRWTERELWLEPTMDDLYRFKKEYLDNATLISFDIETTHGQIECISFAPSPTRGIIVPFVDWRKVGRSYWPTVDEEIEAWEFVTGVLGSPTPKLAQNGVYDFQWLAERAGIEVRNYSEDTRLQHHAIYPELPKDLAFMGSIYENEGLWKLLRHMKAGSSGVFKRDE